MNQDKFILDMIEVLLRNKHYDTYNVFSYLQNNYPEESSIHQSQMIVKKGVFIYRPDDKINKIYQVVDGAIKIGSFLRNGEMVAYDALAKGDIFGNLKYLEGRFFYEFSRAMVDSKINCYDLTFFKKMIVHDPLISEWFNYSIVKRWCGSELKLRATTRHVKEKIFFLRHYFNVPVSDIHNQDYLLFDLLTQKDLADMVGSTRQTISTAIRGITQNDCK